MAVEAEDGSDTVLGVDLDVPGLRQGQVQDLAGQHSPRDHGIRQRQLTSRTGSF